MFSCVICSLVLSVSVVLNVRRGREEGEKGGVFIAV
jgi:hypothetical protein